MTTSCLKKPNLAEISPHLICALCGGYLIDATTIVECLHSFCKTCIVRYLESSKYCPICEVLVHKTRPLQNIRLDHTLQDIVYKLVPGLFKDEMRRRREFYKDSPTIRSPQSRQAQQRHRIIYSADEKFSVSLECSPDGKVRTRSYRRSRSNSKESPPDRRYLLCPASTTVALLKKFIRLKFAMPDKYKVDLFHSDGNLRDTYSLMDIAYIYSWKREGVLQLYYSIFKNHEPTPRIEITEIKEEVKQETIPKVEDNRPSSLFNKAALLANRGMDGDIPHDLSPLELIATVANDVSCLQEGRGLKRKALDIPLYENDDENSNEIQIQKSIEHAIDLCSTGTGNNSQEIPQTSQQSKTKELKNSSNNAPCKPVALDNIHQGIQPSTHANSPNKQSNVVTRIKPKEKPKTTDTASQCDPKPKKHKGDTNNAPSVHSKSPSKPVKLVKDGVNHTGDKTKTKDEVTISKLDKTKQKEDVGNLKSDKTKQKEDVGNLKSDKTKQKEDITNLKLDKTKQKEDITHLKSDKIKQKEDITNLKSDKTKPKEDTANSKSDKIKLKDDFANLKSDKTKLKEEATKPDKTKVKEEATNAKHEKDSTNSNSTNSNSNTFDNNNSVKIKEGVKAVDIVKRETIVANQHTQSITRDASTGKIFTNLKSPTGNDLTNEKTTISSVLNNQKAVLKSQNDTQRKSEPTTNATQINGHAKQADIAKLQTVPQRPKQTDN